MNAPVRSVHDGKADPNSSADVTNTDPTSVALLPLLNSQLYEVSVRPFNAWLPAAEKVLVTTSIPVAGDTLHEATGLVGGGGGGVDPTLAMYSVVFCAPSIAVESGESLDLSTKMSAVKVYS